MLTLIKKLSKEEADFSTEKLKSNEEDMGNWTMSGSGVITPSQIEESRYLILPEQFNVRVNTEDGKQMTMSLEQWIRSIVEKEGAEQGK